MESQLRKETEIDMWTPGSECGQYVTGLRAAAGLWQPTWENFFHLLSRQDYTRRKWRKTWYELTYDKIPWPLGQRTNRARYIAQWLVY